MNASGDIETSATEIARDILTRIDLKSPMNLPQCDIELIAIRLLVDAVAITYVEFEEQARFSPLLLV